MQETEPYYAYLKFHPLSYFEIIAIINEITNTAVWNALAALYEDMLTALHMLAMISELCIKLIDQRIYD